MKEAVKKKFSVKNLVIVIVLLSLIGGGCLYHFTSMNELKQQYGIALSNYENAQTDLNSEKTTSQKLKTELAEEMAKSEALQGEKDSLLGERDSLKNEIAAMIASDEYVFQTDTVKEQLKDIGELATAEYRYTECAGMKASKKLFKTDVDIPLTQKTAIFSMDGVIKVGMDFNKVKIICDENTKTIKVNLPEVKLLSNELDEESIKIYSEKDGLFNAVTINDTTELRKNIKKQTEEKAKTNGMYKQAEITAKNTILLIIESVPGVKNNYTVVFNR